MIPISSIFANSCFATANFLGLRRLAFAKIRGPVVSMCNCTPWLGRVTENIGVVNAGLSCSILRKGQSETTATLVKDVPGLTTPWMMSTSAKKKICEKLYFNVNYGTKLYSTVQYINISVILRSEMSFLTSKTMEKT